MRERLPGCQVTLLPTVPCSSKPVLRHRPACTALLPTGLLLRIIFYKWVEPLQSIVTLSWFEQSRALKKRLRLVKGSLAGRGTKTKRLSDIWDQNYSKAAVKQISQPSVRVKYVFQGGCICLWRPVIGMGQQQCGKIKIHENHPKNVTLLG